MDTKGSTLTPEQIREQVDAWIGRRFDDGGRSEEIVAFHSKMRRIRLTDGRWVTYDETPGWLRLDGERVYSAAWL